MNRLKKLFEPIMIGELQLKNRIIRPGVMTNFAISGIVTDRMKNFYSELARGGVGLIITGGTSSINLGQAADNRLALYSDEFIPGLRELVEIVHAGGARIAAQLSVSAMWRSDEISPIEIIGPSNVMVNPRGGHQPRPLTSDEIKQIVYKSGEASSRARKAGFDAIEFHAGIGQLVNQFISPLTNRRTDEYGGDLNNRMRFFLEIIEEIKKKTGKDFPLIARVSGEDFMEGGHTLYDTMKVASIIEQAGIHAIDVTTGWHEAPVPSFHASVPRGKWVYMAEGIKKAVNIPVVTGTRILDPFFADELIAQGKADLVYMARPLIADPELPNKAREGRFDEIRPCISCSHCFGAIGVGLPMSCSVNARIGKESEYTIEATGQKKKVIIIGGGPAGLEAARVAAMRGHHVILAEKEEQLGGLLLVAEAPPYKEEIGYLTRYYDNQMKKLDVDVRLGRATDVEKIKEMNPDIIIVATGSIPIIPDIPGVDGTHVYTAIDVLADKKSVGKNIVVIGGGFIGCETAEFIAGKGKTVTIVEQLDRLGGDFERTNRWVIMSRLKESGIRMKSRTKVKEITRTGVKAITDGKEEFFEADSVVLAVGMEPNRNLANALNRADIKFHIIGDSLLPQKIAQAVDSGMRIGLEV